EGQAEDRHARRRHNRATRFGKHGSRSCNEVNPQRGWEREANTASRHVPFVSKWGAEGPKREMKGRATQYPAEEALEREPSLSSTRSHCGEKHTVGVEQDPEQPRLPGHITRGRRNPAQGQAPGWEHGPASPG